MVVVPAPTGPPLVTTHLGHTTGVVTDLAMLMQADEGTVVTLAADGTLRFYGLRQDDNWSMTGGRTHLLQATGAITLIQRERSGQGWALVPTVAGIRAFDRLGQPAADWPPWRGGRAVEPAPMPQGVLLAPAPGVALGLSAAGDVTAWTDDGASLPAARVQLRQDPVTAVTAGVLGADPVLLVGEPDSLRVVDLPWFAATGLEAYEGPPGWFGPAGGASATALLVASASPSPGGPAVAAGAFYTYPNPARETCWIRAEGLSGEMVVRAYTAAGTPLGEVARLDAGVWSGVTREAAWDVSRVAPGPYLLVGTVDGTRRLTTRVLVVR
jgi:hypothetical protein